MSLSSKEEKSGQYRHGVPFWDRLMSRPTSFELVCLGAIPSPGTIFVRERKGVERPHFQCGNLAGANPVSDAILCTKPTGPRVLGGGP